jgi:galactose oxidase
MHRSHGLGVVRGFHLALLSVIGALGLLLAGCVDNSGDGAGPKLSPPAETDDSQDAPIRLSYLCGNRFLITNAYTVAVSVRYRVAGSDEEAEALLSAAPSQDPAFSERLIETRNKGSVELVLNGTTIAVRANGGVPCTPSTPAPSFLAVGGPESSGEWTAPFNWPVVAVHLTMMSNGRVLSWGHTGEPQIWDPAAGTFTQVQSPVELFCAGHALTTDGRVVVAGGHITDDHGLPDMSIFTPGSQTWSETAPMMRGRWYPTNTTTGTGEVVIIAGRDEAGTQVTIPEIWNPSGAIRQLTAAPLSLPYYPRMFLAPNGKLFYAGENQRSRWLKITGTGLWTSGPNRLYGVRDYGAAVMYDEGRILYVGGGRTTNTAEKIDLTQTSPTWSWAAAMAFQRRHHNAVILPTGDVLVVGGLSGTAFNDLSTGVHPAEIWNPTNDVWTTLASNTVNRGYHTTAILLPDARVLLTGSGDGAGAVSELNAEVFSPPYLFNGPRPTITSRPSRLSYNTTFRIGTPDAASIARVTLVRLGSTTHAFDMNQRFQKLAFTADATGLTVTAPTTRLRTPQGHYLLFIVNSNGVPSVGKIVQVK